MMSLAGSIIIYTYFFSFRPDQRDWPLTLGAFSVLLMYVLLARACQKWLAVPDKDAFYVQSMRRIIGLQVALGISWSVLMISAVRVADDDQRRMIYALAIALISTTMVSGPARYSFSFWVPVTIGAFITMWADPGHFYLPILIALVCYTLLSAFSIFSMNEKLFEREKNLFEIERHSETIELLLQDFQDGSGSFLWETNAELVITEFSGSHEAFGAARLSPLGTPFICFIKTLVAQGRDGESAETDPGVSLIARHCKESMAFKEVILRQEAAGQTLWWAVSGKPLFDAAGRITGFRGLWSDVTDREEYKNALKFAADRDYLTKLYNRSAFNDILLSSCQGGKNVTASLICIDLDHFKRVNDNFGHSIGDNLLIAVSKRLYLCIRAEDHVFRLGGDEFAILLCNGGRGQAAGVARRVIEQISRPFVISGVRLQIGASIGIALMPAEAADPDTWHRHADTALYHSKANGKCTYSFFEEGAEDPFSSRKIALQMDESVALDQLFLVFQPIVDLRTRRIVAAEALLRWRHPVFGIVQPQDFVPILEKSGQIARVGAFVIEQATRVAARLRPDIIVSINISPLQLADIDLPRKLLSALDAAGLAAGRIELEITESSLLEKDLQKLEVLRQIRTLGCGIALDDFGTGYASLLLLEQFPFSKIKIDGSFVREPGDDARRHLILTSIIKLANDLGICVAAEGIEAEKQARTVFELGCQLGQGFHFSPGLTEEVFLAAASAAGVSAPEAPVTSGV
jgi:diguanylate cyclase (GGDEF)-like protein